MTFGRKRVFAMPMAQSARPSKKRKMGRFKRRGRRSSGFTSKAGYGSIVAMRSRKLSRRRWNAMLWNSTLQKAHYRCAFAESATEASPANSAQVRFVSRQAIHQAFYTTAGGALALDTGVAVPTFRDDIIIRGGKVGLRMANQATDTFPIQVFVYLIKTVDGSNINTLYGAGASVPVGWDPTANAEFAAQTGKVIAKKAFLLENSSTAEFVIRLKIQKIDQVAYIAWKGRLVWLVGISNVENATATSLTLTNYNNLSFSGDAA